MDYMITTADTINNVTTVNVDTNIDNTTTTIDNTNSEHLEPFQYVLAQLVEHGWLFVKSDSNIITMSKLFYELQEITIEYKYNHYHLTLPINNSIYSYYKKIPDFYDALDYLELYVDNLF